MDECIIIVPTNSAYLDVFRNFIYLYRKNAGNLKYKLVVALTGEDYKIEECEKIYCGHNASLPECVVSVTNRYRAKAYLCLLGDAFIYKKVDENELEKLLQQFIDNQFEYCRVIPHKGVYKKIFVGDSIVKMDMSLRYSHSFIAFLATKKFIDSEFANGTTDLEFEKKYNDIAVNNKKGKFYQNRVMLSKNILNIIPGIDKGKWNRIAIKKIRFYNKEMTFCNRDTITYKWQIYLLFRDLIVNIIPNGIIKYLHTR